MNRRRAIAALAALGAAAIRGAHAQAQPRMPRVYTLHFGSAINYRGRAEAFRKGMEALGYVDGVNVRYQVFHANGQFDLLQEGARRLTRGPVDVIISTSTLTTQALQKLTSTIPIVMGAADDPIADGVARSLARPGGNFTGVSTNVVEHAPKFVELLGAALGKPAHFGALLSPANSTYRAYRASLEGAARRAGAELVVVDANNAEETERAFTVIDEGRVDGLIVMSDSLFYTDRTHITELAATARVPTIYPLRGYVEVGGLMSYGPRLEQNFERAAAYVDRILKGANPRDMAIEQPTRYELVINRAVVRSLGLALPADLVKRAELVGKV